MKTADIDLTNVAWAMADYIALMLETMTVTGDIDAIDLRHRCEALCSTVDMIVAEQIRKAA